MRVIPLVGSKVAVARKELGIDHQPRGLGRPGIADGLRARRGLGRILEIANIGVHVVVVFVGVGDGRSMLAIFAFDGGLVATLFRFCLLLFLPLEFFLSLLKCRCHRFCSGADCVDCARKRIACLSSIADVMPFSETLWILFWSGRGVAVGKLPRDIVFELCCSAARADKRWQFGGDHEANARRGCAVLGTFTIDAGKIETGHHSHRGGHLSLGDRETGWESMEMAHQAGGLRL